MQPRTVSDAMEQANDGQMRLTSANATYSTYFQQDTGGKIIATLRISRFTKVVPGRERSSHRSVQNADKRLVFSILVKLATNYVLALFVQDWRAKRERARGADLRKSPLLGLGNTVTTGIRARNCLTEEAGFPQ